ncbi:MAG TPA: hypothetical protein VK253_08510 [Candidatus Binatia bacterium]|nr:hypothetical protein [Candidatus Binatia bacterium]
MDYKIGLVASVWLSVAAVAIAYMVLYVNKIGDVLFGLFLPVGIVVLIAAILTVYVISRPSPKQQKVAQTGT